MWGRAQCRSIVDMIGLARAAPGADCGTSRPPVRGMGGADGRRVRFTSTPVVSAHLQYAQGGYGSSEISLVISASGHARTVRVRVPQGADRHRKLRDVVGVWCLQNEQKVRLTRGEKSLLNLNIELFCNIARGLSTLGRLFNSADPLVGPGPRHYERRHGIVSSPQNVTTCFN